MTLAKMDYIHDFRKYSLCGDWDEIVYHILSKYSKLVQNEFKTRHDLMKEYTTRIVQEINVWPCWQMV